MLKVCVLGLGYVGLPVALNISRKFKTIGFDISLKRIKELKNKFDHNKEFKKSDFIKKKNKIFLQKTGSSRSKYLYYLCSYSNKKRLSPRFILYKKKYFNYKQIYQSRRCYNIRVYSLSRCNRKIYEFFRN